MTEFRLDANALPWGAFVADLEGRITHANDALARLLGRQVARELIGEPVGGLLIGEELLESWLKAPRSVSLVVAGPGGERTIVVDGRRGPDSVDGWVVDGSAPELPDVYTSLVENSPFALVVIQDGTVVYANRQQEELSPSLGRRADEIVFQNMHPEDRELVSERIRAREAGEDVPGHYRFRQIRNGEVVWCEVWSHRVSYRGRPAVQAMTIDVTARVDRERAIADLDARYQHAQKLEAVGRLAGGVAHDFNNLLTVIIASAQLAASGSDLPPRTLNELAQIRDAAQRAAELTRQLLAFSRREPLERTRVDVNRLVAGMQNMLQRLIGESIELRAVLLAGPIWVELGSGQLEQIVANLVVNACDAMPLGGEVVVRSQTVDRAHPDTGDETRFVALSVSDGGVGISPEVLPKVFEPFFTTKEIGKGTGLGLPTVLGVTQNAGGFIEIESTPDVGTTMVVFLPVVEAPTDAAKTGHRGAAGTRAGRVLVVEDERLVRNVTERILAARGFDVRAVASAADALALLEHSPDFDVVLTDVVMPGMSGFDLAQRLAVAYPQLAVRFMTGYADDRAVPPGYELKDTALLRKPFTPEDLVGLIQAALAHRARTPAVR